MKKQLFVLGLAAIAALGTITAAKAESSSGTSELTGYMSTVLQVTGTNGSGTISGSTGAWSPTTNPSFSVLTNKAVSLTFKATPGTMSVEAIGKPESSTNKTVKLVLAKNDVLDTARVTNALLNSGDGTAPTPANNIDVIAYDITFDSGSTGVTIENYSGGNQLTGSISSPGTKSITSSIITSFDTGTWSNDTDTAGEYKAHIILTASDT